MDGNGQDEVIISFGAIGLWVRKNDTDWVKLHNANAGSLVTGNVAF